MVNRKLSNYINIVTHDKVHLCDDLCNITDTDVDYKLILSFEDDRKSISKSLEKKLVSKIKALNPKIKERFTTHRYILEQYKTGDLYIAEFRQGPLKDKYKDHEG